MKWLCILTLLTVGCGGFPAGLAKTHEGLKAMSKEIEPKLAAACMVRAVRCAQAGVTKAEDCEPLMVCRRWKTRYVTAAKLTHRGLSACNAVYLDLQKAGVIHAD